MELFCQEEKLPVLMRIPLERRFAEGIARGGALVEIEPAYIPRFLELFKSLALLRYQEVV